MKLLPSILATLLLTFASEAQVPQILNYQGRVAVGGVNFDGTGQFKFALVNSDGTETFWSNDGTSTIGDEPTAAVPLPVAKGLYSVLLGDDVSLANMLPVPPSVFANPDVRLRVWFDDGVNGAQLLTPDQRIAAVGYAMVAADVADGSITAAKIAPEAIDASHIAPGAITGDRLAAGSLDSTLLLTAAPPEAGQVLSFDGANLVWGGSGGGGGDSVFGLNGTSAYYNGGFVGIGRNNPVAKLDLYDIGSIVERIETGGGTGAGTVVQFGNLSGDWNIGTSRGLNGDQFYVARSAGALFSILPNGSVAIGRNNPVAKLDLYDANSVVERIETGGGTNAQTLLQFGNLNGDWNIGTSRGFNGDQFYFARSGGGPQFSIQPNGDVTYVGKLNKLDTTEQFTATIRAADFFLGSTAPGRRGSPGRALVDLGTSLVVNFGNDWGTTTIGGEVTEVKSLRILGGADLAEPFAMSQRGVEPGMVVVIDEENPGKLRRSAAAYDRKVAGIVSGAGGIKAGISMIQKDALEAGENVALSGRVFVKANTSGGAIKPGDLLTTSNIPGEAMKAADHERAQGSILGKAMTPLDETTGTVLVLVTLQ